MILDVRHLEMVRAIHGAGTLTEAAQRLFISQPALSRQLAKLERRIGAKLFRRHHKGMTLTREGERVLLSAERVLGEVSRAEQEVRLLAEGRIGTVRVTTECYMCYHWLPWVARAFAARFPGVDVQLAPEETRNPYDALKRAEVDVALVFSPPPEGTDVARVEIFDDELVALVSDEHKLAKEPWLTAASFAGETLLCHYAEPGRGVLEREFLERAGVRPGRTMELLVTPAVIEMARAGYGVAVVPRWILAAQGSLEGLTIIPLGKGGLRRAWYAACDSTRSGEPVLRAIIELLRSESGKDGVGVPRGIRLVRGTH